jgi:NitT/TauT family transport system ATP-binding protein
MAGVAPRAAPLSRPVPAATLSVQELRLRYPGASSQVVDGLSFSVGGGEFVTLVGSSGVGKSTVLRAVDGLFPIESGRVELGVFQDSPERRSRAFVFQDARLLPWRTVLGNVSYGLESLRLPRPVVRERALEALRSVGLEGLAERYPRQLSGGQRQRVGIARALAVEPGLLLMDEPFSSVDAITRRDLQQELVRIWQERGCAVLFVTHDVEEAVFLSDRVLLLAGTPSRVAREITVDTPRPRRRNDPGLVRLAAGITADLERFLSP